MNLKLIKEEKTVLPRKKATFTLTFEDVTPSRAKIIQSISTKLKAKQELIIVKKIDGAYGEKIAEVTTYIYDNEDALKAIEFEKVIAKNTPPKPEVKEEEKSESKEDDGAQNTESPNTEKEGE